MGPRVVVLENVAALLTRGMGDVLGTLASLGYDAEWHCIPAAAVGAPHIRDRVFLLAYHDGGDCRASWPRKAKAGTANVTVAGSASAAVANAAGQGLEKRQGEDASGARSICGSKSSRSEWWELEPDVGRVADGVPKRVDRLRALGNAVVPHVAEFVGRMVVESLNRQPD
jgi:DNA (cytosine-5)-methyltransferase 1